MGCTEMGSLQREHLKRTPSVSMKAVMSPVYSQGGRERGDSPVTVRFLVTVIALRRGHRNCAAACCPVRLFVQDNSPRVAAGGVAVCRAGENGFSTESQHGSAVDLYV